MNTTAASKAAISLSREPVAILAIYFLDGESRYLLEPLDDLTPEKIFDRRWATTLLDQAMSCLRKECIVSDNRSARGVAEEFCRAPRGSWDVE